MLHDKLSSEFIEGKKNDQEKIRMDLLPFDVLEEIAKGLTFGAKKYSDNNWQKVENAQERYEAALLRHFADYKKGEKLDNESGLSHLIHLGCNAIFLIWLDLHKEELTDDARRGLGS